MEDADEKLRALEAFSDRLLPGRWAEVGRRRAKELKATSILRLPLDEASAKLRVGPPKDDEEDYGWPVWAGVIPLALARASRRPTRPWPGDSSRRPGRRPARRPAGDLSERPIAARRRPR